MHDFDFLWIAEQDRSTPPDINVLPIVILFFGGLMALVVALFAVY